MRDTEEHALIKKVEEAGHEDIAAQLYKVINKRDAYFKEIFDKFEAMEKKQLEACSRLENMDMAFQQHMRDELTKLEEFMEDVKAGFPEEDFAGHKQFHVLWLAKEKQRLELRQAIIDKSLSGLLWAGMVFLGYAIFNYLKHLFHITS